MRFKESVRSRVLVSALTLRMIMLNTFAFAESLIRSRLSQHRSTRVQMQQIRKRSHLLLMRTLRIRINPPSQNRKISGSLTKRAVLV